MSAERRPEDGEHSRAGEAASGAARPGVGYLVGAGSGDPGLMTARSLELIAAADVVLHDRLIPAGALDGARADAELIYVGKKPADPAKSQAEINRLLVEHVGAGRSVVRLKGGDPFVFGRGGEEAEALAEAELPFEVVPGVTAGVAASAYAGIPVTHREDASAVAFVTGHEDPAKPESALDYDALAAFPGTLVLYMGVRRLPEIAAKLIASGRNAEEPAAVIESGTLPGQRVVTGTLATIGALAEEAAVKPPALTVIGAVAARREQLAWLEKRPLSGKRVIVTRARAQASGLARRLAALGAEPVELPAIRIEPLIDTLEVRQAVADLNEYELICLTSPNGVRLLFEAMDEAGIDARAMAGCTVAAIGPGTARALAERGIHADIVPERFVAESLIESLAEVVVEGKRALVARAAEARDVLPDDLRARGAELDVVSLYETVREQPSAADVARAGGADYVTFTSSSTVTNLLEAVGAEAIAGARVVSIGPITSEAARAAGLTVDLEAKRHDIDGLVAALVDDAAIGSAP